MATITRIQLWSERAGMWEDVSLDEYARWSEPVEDYPELSPTLRVSY